MKTQIIVLLMVMAGISEATAASPSKSRTGKRVGVSTRRVASHQQPQQCKEIVEKRCRQVGLSDADRRFLIACGKVESGLDPRAKNRTTGAEGLFQFLTRTWQAMCRRTGQSPSTSRSDPVAQAKNIIPQLEDMKAWAKTKVGKRYSQKAFYAWCYKFHHDGPTQEHGGLKLGQQKVVPLMSAID